MKGYVLAGGASSRMGRDKARIPHGDRPIAIELLERLARAGCEPTLVRRGAETDAWVPDPWRVLREPEQGLRHPLNGIAAALDDAAADVLVIPCDVPRLTVEDLVRLREAGPCVAEGARVHPLVAVIPYALRDRVHALIASGGPARALVRDLPRLPIEPDHLFDRNTPADLGVCSPTERTGGER